MEKDSIINNTMGGLADLPVLPAVADSKGPYADDGIYPEEDDLANALCLLNLMVSRNRIRKNEPSGRPEMRLIPKGIGYADL